MTAQNCPKCGSVAYSRYVSDTEFVYSCSKSTCAFWQARLALADWNALRYVKPISPAMQRCMDAVADKPKARRMKANMCLAGSDRSEMPHTVEHDEMPTCGRFSCRPVDPTPTEPEWEDVALSRDFGDMCLAYWSDRHECDRDHHMAVSEPGFMYYVYPNGDHSYEPCRWNEDAGGCDVVEFPVAWRRRIEKKGGS